MWHHGSVHSCLHPLLTRYPTRSAEYRTSQYFLLLICLVRVPFLENSALATFLSRTPCYGDNAHAACGLKVPAVHSVKWNACEIDDYCLGTKYAPKGANFSRSARLTWFPMLLLALNVTCCPGKPAATTTRFRADEQNRATKVLWSVFVVSCFQQFILATQRPAAQCLFGHCRHWMLI